MAIYNFSYHADLYCQKNIGLLVWDEELSDLRYYEARDEQAHSSGFKQRIDGLKKEGPLSSSDIEDALEYFLERGGGGYLSFSVPERIEAESFEDAARKVVAASKHGLELVILEQPERAPEPQPEFPGYVELDSDVVFEMLTEAGHGAYIHLRGPDWKARDMATMCGMWDGPPMNVFTYLPYPVKLPPMSGLRFAVRAISHTTRGWVLEGHAISPGDCPATVVVVRPVRDKRFVRRIDREWNALPKDVQEGLMTFLKSETDPTLV